MSCLFRARIRKDDYPKNSPSLTKASPMKNSHCSVSFVLISLDFSRNWTARHLRRAWRFPQLGLAAFAFTGFLSYTGCSKTFVPGDAQATCIVTSGGAPPFATWFDTGTVTLNGSVKPADSLNFPNSPNCSFYQWSEQMFLWLTSPAPSRYGGDGRIFDSPVFYDVSPPDANGDRTLIPHVPGMIRNFSLRSSQVGPNNLQLIFDKKGRLLEIEPPTLGPSGKPLLRNEKGESVEIERIAIGENKKPVFFDKTGSVIPNPRPLIRQELDQDRIVQKFMIEKTPIFLNSSGNVIDVEQGQAGGDAVLQARNGSLVYYVTMVNDVYAYFLTGTKSGGITPTPTQFPTSQADLNKIIAFAANAGPNAKTFPDPEALAVEVKSSWVEATAVPNPADYITMTATIPTYNQTNANQWTPNGQKTVKLAMVGIHVVGSTKGHQEMLWATFEHQSNMPNATYSYINTSNVVKTVAQSTSGNWVFCTPNSAGPFNQEHMSFNSPNIDANTSSGFAISPSDTIRWKAWGGASDQSPNPIAQPTNPATAASNTEIISMNNSVRGGLVSGDVRINYVFEGAAWTIGGAAPTGSFPNGNEVGTSKLCNATMETYQQGSNSLFNTGTNCFSCHRTNIVNSSKNVQQVSHIFGPLKKLF